MNRFILRSCCTAATAIFICTPVWSADQVLVQGNGVAITVADIEADALRIPLESRGVALSNPTAVAQAAQNLYVRRVMAAQAAKDGLEADPKVKAALVVARDRALSDAVFERMDQANTPNPKAAEAIGRDLYRAKPERFQREDEVHVSHILIAGQGDDSRIKAERLLRDLKAGADFKTLAKEHSADPGTAKNGGDLGTFARGRMVPAFDEAAFALQKPGDLSGVVATQFGFHVLRLDERLPAGLRPYEEVREQLRTEIQNNMAHNARVAAAEKIQQGVVFNQEAISAFTAGKKDAAAKAP